MCNGKSDRPLLRRTSSAASRMTRCPTARSLPVQDDACVILALMEEVRDPLGLDRAYASACGAGWKGAGVPCFASHARAHGGYASCRHHFHAGVTLMRPQGLSTSDSSRRVTIDPWASEVNRMPASKEATSLARVRSAPMS